MNTSTSLIVDSEDEYSVLQHSLEAAFGTPFDLWVHDDDWCSLSDNLVLPSGSGDPHVYIAELLSSNYCQKGPATVLMEATGGTLVVVPSQTSSTSRPTCMVGIVESPELKLIQSLADATFVNDQNARSLEENSQHLDAYIAQVSKSFDELTWLRTLTELIDQCDIADGIQTVTSTILPSLCEILDAESLVFLRGPLDCPETSLNAVGRTYSREIWFTLCKVLNPDRQIRPVVDNKLNKVSELDQHGIQNSVMIPVAKGTYICGWLLAVNKAKSHESTAMPPSFGTMEASIMSTSAVILANFVHNAELLQQKEDLLIEVIRSLTNGLGTKDSYTRGHSDRVALMSRRISRELGQSTEFCRQIYVTGLLHDIGKIGVPDRVLLKAGKLTDEEFDLMKQHPYIGYCILKHLSQLQYALPGVLHHHESVDGTGYPHQLAGEEIPYAARILAVADAFDAMTSSRPYRKAMSRERAEHILTENSGIQWDSEVVEAYFRCSDDLQELCQEYVDELHINIASLVDECNLDQVSIAP